MRAAIGVGALTLMLVAAACNDATGTTPSEASSDASSDGAVATTDDSIGASSTSLTDDTEASPTTSPSTRLAGDLSITIVAAHPHDADAFTQGLEVHEGQFVESTGLYGESDRRLVEIDTGQVTAIVDLDDDLFGEGLTVVDGEILQLTWQAGVMIRSDATTLAELSRTSYEGQGWGLCFDGAELAMSNGSSSLTFRDPATFEIQREVVVTNDGVPVELLNELECVNGQILANVWLSDLIVVIDPASGVVEATLDASALRPAGAPRDDDDFALNGIAFDPSTGHFYLTGKLWPVLYEVELS